MTYPEFIKYCQRRQREYIRGEQKRMKKARVLCDKYVASMLKLGLHPLSRVEIVDRQRDLDRMSTEVLTTHGDSVTMRYAWEHYVKDTESLT